MGEWDNRELCPDDSCVGVIGKDGTCGVCGRVSPGGVKKPAAAPADAEVARDDHDADGADADAAATPDDAADQTPAAAAVDAETGDDWDQRSLCPDGACTGVIQSGGKCSVCGRTAAEITADSSP